jgi:hypothetical protein
MLCRFERHTKDGEEPSKFLQEAGGSFVSHARNDDDDDGGSDANDSDANANNKSDYAGIHGHDDEGNYNDGSHTLNVFSLCIRSLYQLKISQNG